MKMIKKYQSHLFFSKTWQFLNEYLPNQAGRSIATVESYRDSLTVIKNYIVNIQHIPLTAFQFSDCTKDFLYGFREYLLKSGIKPSSVNVRMAAVRAYLNYAADTDISVQSVALAVSQIKPCKMPQKEKEIITEEALTALLEAPPNTKMGIRDRTILVMLYDTALRVSELLNIRLCDIVLENKYPSVFITGKGNKERSIQLTEQTAAHVKYYIQIYHSNSSETAYLFSTTIKGNTEKMSPENVQRLIKKYAQQVRCAGFDLPESVHPHMFRRTRATNVYQDGVPLELVSTVLGHAKIDTTKIYAKPSVEQLRNALDSVPPPVNEQPIWDDNEEELARRCGLR